MRHNTAKLFYRDHSTPFGGSTTCTVVFVAPASTVVVVPAEGESDWETNNEHERAYAFDLQVFYSTKQLGNDVALDRLYNVVDLILDAFAEDTQFLLPTVISLPAKKTMITVQPVSAGWEALEDTELLLAKISLKVIVSVDVT